MSEDSILNQISVIKERKLYLGGEYAAKNKVMLTEHGITHIVNMTMFGENFFPGSYEYYSCRLADSDTEDILSLLKDGIQFIRKFSISILDEQLNLTQIFRS
jgi:hypothetical protein